MKKRLTSLLLALTLALTCLTPSLAAETGGTFWLTASTADTTLIEPAAVSYTAGQTVLQALEGSGYAFTREGGMVTAICGRTGNYTVYYDGGGYDLDAPASAVTAVSFSEYTGVYDSSLTSLTALMGRCRARTDNVQHYPPAASAYEAGLTALRAGGWSAAYASLESAMADYDAIRSGPQHTVTLTARRGDSAVPAARLTLTDAYGNVTVSDTGSARVVAGAYTYAVSDGSDRTEGTLTVSGDTALAAALPEGRWFGDVEILLDGTALSGTQDAAARQAVYQLPDACGRTGLTLYACRGADTPANARLRTIYTDVDGRDCSAISRSWNSAQTSLARLTDTGMTDCTFRLEAQYDVSGATQIQSYTVTLRRTPTLTALTVTDGGVDQPLDFSPDTLSYTVPVLSEAVTVSAQPYDASYAVSGAGDVALTADRRTHTVSVTAAGRTAAYTLTLEKTAPAVVRVTAPEGVTVSVTNRAGAAIAPDGDAYRLLPGATYICTASRDGCHAQQTFTAADGLTVTAAAPETAEALTALALYDSSTAASRTAYVSRETFTPAQRTLTYTVPDTAQRLYAQADAADGYTVTATYARQTTVASTDGQPASVTLKRGVSASGAVDTLPSCLTTGGRSQTVTLRVHKTVSDITYYQDYTLSLCRLTQLRTLTLGDGTSELRLCGSDGQPCAFRSDRTAYTVTVPRDLTALTVTGTFVGEGYTAEVNGVSCADLTAVAAPLDPDKAEETVTIRVCGADSAAVPAVYTVTVRKQEPVPVTFHVTPADAAVFLTDTATGRRVAPDHGNTWRLMPSGSYAYTVTRYGYAAVSNDSYTAPAAAAEVSVTLTAVPDSGRQQLPSAWPSFRADGSNNGVVDAPVPTAPEDAMLSWATQLGEGYSADACGCPILVDGCLYTYARSTLYKVDAVSGQVLATGAMDHSSSFAINTPTYAEGMIFVGLSDGTVQAFDAVTLRSLWIYRDPLKGQPNCPLVYRGGYLYTGFWNGETLDANYVCLSVTDEDPTRADEAKLASWTYTSRGGFYWSGAYVGDTAVVVPTDDGASGYTTGYGRLLSLDPRTGLLKDVLTMPYTGDLRSSVTYDGGVCYFTSKGGYFYAVDLLPDGTFRSGSLRALRLDNYAADSANPAMSTSTPTVYNGRAYVGVSGVGQFKAYSGHNITVIDLPSWTIAYTVRTQGYPQTSALLTTAYEKETGSVCVYFFDNYTPGKLRMLRDKAGQTAPDTTEVETVVAGGQIVSYDTAPVLFTPSGEQQQYAICSPIVDESGTIYFKNDSAYLMALTSTVSRLEIVTAPDKTSYTVGDAFDPAGMQVLAHYTNGCTRDVTKYVTWDVSPLTADSARFRIEFPYAMYQNADGRTGVSCVKPAATLNLTIGEALTGDLNGDGAADDADAALLYAYLNGRLPLTDRQLLLADVDGSGTVDAADADLLYRTYLGDAR